MRSTLNLLSAALLSSFLFFRPATSAAPPQAPPEPQPQSAKSAACSAPEYSQFDFWVGDWDAFDVDTHVKSARNHVDSVLDGCVIREDYLKMTACTARVSASTMHREKFGTKVGSPTAAYFSSSKAPGKMAR